MISMFAAGCASETKFYGDAKTPHGERGCADQCKDKDLIFSGMITLGEYSDGCVCTTAPISSKSSSDVVIRKYFTEYNQDLKLVQNLLDKESDINQTEQIRLQRATEQRQKAMEMLSNIIKKFSDTEATITKNLK